MDGKGRWRDNVFVERIWRTIKYEEVYLRAYDSVHEARTSLGKYIEFYNRTTPLQPERKDSRSGPLQPPASTLGSLTQTESPPKKHGHLFKQTEPPQTIAYQHTKPSITLDHRRITLTVRPGSDAEKRSDIMHEWHKSLLHQVVPSLIQKWESKLGVRVEQYFLQRMKTKWGSCNHAVGHIRLNTQLVAKPKNLLEYVIVHEMVHLIEPTHSERFLTILGKHYPTWREARAELNELPLAAESWQE
jgi:predicted metal-dependent hydrolase